MRMIILRDFEVIRTDKTFVAEFGGEIRIICAGVKYS